MATLYIVESVVDDGGGVRRFRTFDRAAAEADAAARDDASLNARESFTVDASVDPKGRMAIAARAALRPPQREPVRVEPTPDPPRVEPLPTVDETPVVDEPVKEEEPRGDL